MAGAVYWIGQDGNIWIKDSGGYNENMRLQGRNQEFKQLAYQKEINAIDDIVVRLWKKP